MAKKALGLVGWSYGYDVCKYFNLYLLRDLVVFLKKKNQINSCFELTLKLASFVASVILSSKYCLWDSSWVVKRYVYCKKKTRLQSCLDYKKGGMITTGKEVWLLQERGMITTKRRYDYYKKGGMITTKKAVWLLKETGMITTRKEVLLLQERGMINTKKWYDYNKKGGMITTKKEVWLLQEKRYDYYKEKRLPEENFKL